jgi:hypothetical protein
MAAITNTARPKEQPREQLKAALSAYWEMLDTFVNHRAPRAAAETDRIPAPRIPNAQSKSAKPQ